ncbi:insulin-like growth factor 1 receptor [Paramacrobiotus metropolitanus]|uniref:insulin-like growth factor 1 receptor n=1 Tax=Paramacrobiotus metropolitanus TaxID=2943436 RepID=UPI0024464D3F|nr:insulin-like growth factor 1 receptor [Paramacrobiotus metropolitanus]XP_055329804.1 insulin-like growth factor 1 receptor [Paramacrobiotus metropolitanus]
MELHMDGIHILNLTVPGLDSWPALGIMLDTSIDPGTLVAPVADADACVSPALEWSHEWLIDYIIVRQYRSNVHQEGGVQITLGVAIPLAAAALGIILCLILLRRARRRRIERTMSKLTIVASRASNPYLTAFEFTAEAADLLTNEWVRAMEIPLANVQTAEIVLGRGATSVVSKGVVDGLAGQPRLLDVAVKSVRDHSETVERRQLVQELKVMAKLNCHPNIVRLIGVALRGELLLVVE